MTTAELDGSRQDLQKYLDVLQRSGLVESERLVAAAKEFRAQTSSQRELRQDVEALGQFLINARLLTGWQHSMLREGRHKGFVLGKYRLLSELGAGGMSTVYLAEHVSMRRRAALKVLHPSRIDQKTFLPRFLREARAIAALDHPHIVRVYDVDNEDKTFFMAMEYIEGVDLQRRVAIKGTLSYLAAAHCIKQAADGLVHAHERGLIHRDIKPSNLLVDRANSVKILDLGLVQLTGDEKALTIEHNERVLGTADYLAPEQAVDSHHIDSRADIYGLGCTLYFLLTGSPPFNEGTVLERLLKHQTEYPRSIFNFRPDAPPDLVDICNRMMAKSPADRFQTAGDVSTALDEWMKERRRRRAANGGPNGHAPEGGAESVQLFTELGRVARSGATPSKSRAGVASDAEVHQFLSAMSNSARNAQLPAAAYHSPVRETEAAGRTQIVVTIGLVLFVLGILGFVLHSMQR